MSSQSEIDSLLAEAESLVAAAKGQDASAPTSPPPSETPTPPDSPVAHQVPDTSGDIAAAGQASDAEVQRVLRLEVPVIVQLASRIMKTQDVLDLNIGSIIEFDKRFDAELDLIVTNRRIGRGNAVWPKATA